MSTNISKLKYIKHVAIVRNNKRRANEQWSTTNKILTKVISQIQLNNKY